MASKPTGKRELSSPLAKVQDMRAEKKEVDDHQYSMRAAELWVLMYAPRGSKVQQITKEGFYYRKPGQSPLKREFTSWLSI